MLRNEDNKIKSQEDHKKAKFAAYKETWSMYGSLFPQGPVCQYKIEQASATAKWWLQMLKTEAPKIAALLNRTKKEPVQLTQAQEDTFVKSLTDSIWLECQNPELQIGGLYLRIEYNGQHWNLVKDAMKSINFSIKGDEAIQCGIMTVIEQNGRATFQIGSNLGDIYRSDNQALRTIDTDNYPSRQSRK